MFQNDDRKKQLDITLNKITKLALSKTEMQGILQKNMLINGLPPFAACQLAWELQEKGFGPYPQIHKVPNNKQKIILKYPTTVFMAEVGEIDYLGSAKLEVLKRSA